MHTEEKTTKRPLYVDLDGTFIKSDMLFETFVDVLRCNPLLFFSCLIWLLKGRQYLKFKLAEKAKLDVGSLPLNKELYNFLNAQHESGREIILATASNNQVAKAFVKHYPIFRRYIASTDSINLKNRAKLAAIQSETKDFDYIGNSSDDIIILEQANTGYLCSPSNKAVLGTRNFSISKVFDARNISATKLWIKQLRIHQWIKNTLIFVPLFVSNTFYDIKPLLYSLLAFISFSMLASATYIVNDLLDLHADRLHARKQSRPLASCSLPINQAIVVTIILITLSLAIALYCGLGFSFTLVSYLVLTLFYSFKLKRYFGMDVITLASLYTIRIFAGAAVIGVVISFWLLSFSMFIFLSLALVKRCAELVSLQQENRESVSGRDYNVTDLQVFMAFGVCSAMLAILMFCFYMNSQVLVNQYQQPEFLWVGIPALGYWLMRMWVKTQRGEMHDDPIVFTLKDKGSLLSIGVLGISTILANIV